MPATARRTGAGIVSFGARKYIIPMTPNIRMRVGRISIGAVWHGSRDTIDNHARRRIAWSQRGDVPAFVEARVPRDRIPGQIEPGALGGAAREVRKIDGRTNGCAALC